MKAISSKYGLPEDFFKGKAKVEVLKVKENKRLFFLDGKPLVFTMDSELYPTLIFFEALARLPKIVVDMGAVSHICNGADVMMPGVKRIDGAFKENSLVLIVDEKHGKTLAIGVALINSEEAKNLRKGKLAKNLHYVGDEVWKNLSNLA
ncbi:Tma20 N-terminal domain-containing protein [Candidatus Bathyarchaeota archaeon]|nr:Tma20 N-terminal domain-containing protein [Candidatus Bathyarchaeota archaeon]